MERDKHHNETDDSGHKALAAHDAQKDQRAARERYEKCKKSCRAFRMRTKRWWRRLGGDRQIELGLTLVIAVSTAAYAIVASKQWSTMQRALQLQESQFSVSEQAFEGVSQPIPYIVSLKRKAHSQLVSSAPIQFVALVKNVGTGPAFTVRWGIGWTMSPAPKHPINWKQPDESLLQGPGVIGKPGILALLEAKHGHVYQFSVTLTEPQLDALVSGEQVIRFFGGISHERRWPGNAVTSPFQPICFIFEPEISETDAYPCPGQ
jgi:hypothetical protein